MGDVTDAATRGPSSSSIREFVCKDCQREVDALRKKLAQAVKHANDRHEIARLEAQVGTRESSASRYNEHWAQGVLDRGGSRSDRCKEHRAKHRVNTQGMAVAYIDLQTVGEVADRVNPTGPLGGLGPLPDKHKEVANTTYDLMEANVGMTDAHALTMIRMLREKRVLVLKAGTGTGKSTFAPYRLMDPPPESYRDLRPGEPFAKLTDLGQIVVTEPRVQAARGVAEYVGGTLSGAGGFGPGFPVGYQVSGDRNHDEACQLVYVTDGTMINWLREGRLSRIGTVIVDEAHERSVNIDFIMGYLRRELDRYPHLRVIITSATFDAVFYQEFFGGPDVANILEVPATKSFGYGMPLFPELDAIPDGDASVADKWRTSMVTLDEQGHPLLSLSGSAESRPIQDFIAEHWKDQFAPALPADDVRVGVDASPEDVWETTEKLVGMRFKGQIAPEDWQEKMPDVMAKFVIELAEQLDEEDIFGDILGFLPTTKSIESVVDQIKKGLGAAYRDDVFPLISSLEQSKQRRALAKRRKGDPRKIVISTNLAETSLTVEGVRFVVDSGIIAQSEWDPAIAQGGVRTKLHSQSGIKQRWGRVGRKAPGWVFPLYTKRQFLDLQQDTPPGSTRENLEALVMTARMGGIDDVAGFPWPAAFSPKITSLEPKALEDQKTFTTELRRADAALRAGGAVDRDGHPTSFGKELSRFSSLGSANALSVLYADRLACVPEVSTVISLLTDTRLVGSDNLLQDNYEWPDEWRLEAARSHRALADLAEDDAHLVLLIMAAWERADPLAPPPWEESHARQRWARQWWVNDAVLLAAAQQRQEILTALSPAMKEEVKRFVEPALLDRARGVLTRGLASQIYQSEGEAFTLRAGPAAMVDLAGDVTVGEIAQLPDSAGALVEDDALIRPDGQVLIAMRRRKERDTDQTRISGLVLAAPWAVDELRGAVGATDAIRLLVQAAQNAKPDPTRNLALGLIETWPAGSRIRITVRDQTAEECHEIIQPFARPNEPTAKKRRRRRPDDGDGATRNDTNTELSGQRQGDRDEDELAEAAFRRADRESATTAACLECFACQDGRPEECEDPGGSGADHGGGRNPLEGWRERVGKQTSQLRHPMIEGVGNSEEPQWVEVIGFALGEDRPTLLVQPDWRPAGFRGNPAQHSGVEPGQPIEVLVGPVLEHRGGKVRAFLRADGQGRFILRDASNPKGDVQESRREIAVALDRGTTGSLEELKVGRRLVATVVPARFPGCYSVTLLELLHQHLLKAVTGAGVVMHQIDRRTTTRLHPATITEAANAWGWVTATLQHHDSEHGIDHRFRFRTGRNDPQAPQSAPPGESSQRGRTVEPQTQEPLSPAALELHQRVLVNLARDQAELDVSDLALVVLDQIVKDSSQQVELDFRGKRPQRDDDAKGADTHTLLAPAGTTLRTVTDRPLSRAAAAALLDANDEDPDWPNEVWSFWARSHHLRMDRKTPYYSAEQLPASDDRIAALCDVAASVTLVEDAPASVARHALSDFLNEHPLGSTITVTVERLTQRGADVLVAAGVKGAIPRQELAWKDVKEPSVFVSPGEQIEAVLTSTNSDQTELFLSYREAQHASYDLLKSSLRVGAEVAGRVRGTSSGAAFLVLYGGVVGLVRASDLSYEAPTSVADVVQIGSTLRGAVTRFDDELRELHVSVKALLPDPYPAFKVAHPTGTDLELPVRSVSSGVLNLDLGGGVRGFIKRTDYAHDPPADLSTTVEANVTLRCRVMEFLDEQREVRLSSKVLQPNPYDVFKRGHSVGQDVEGKARRVTEGAAFITLEGAAQGVVRRSDFAHEPPADMTSAISPATLSEPGSWRLRTTSVRRAYRPRC